ncbi:MAG TPA: hypothetical protein VFP49_00060, partial [Nitrososphaeraceae archaeon]|nr:hypothetical protein [Nitrososphaeraceae archaeon]
FDFYISFLRLVYDKKLSDAYKEYMKLYLGEQKLNHKLALIYDLRKKMQKNLRRKFKIIMTI